jgi:hypothetical protein
MMLDQFDARGAGISDAETEEIIREGDPHRSLVRYRPDGSELFVHVRINVDSATVAGIFRRIFSRKGG